jgi:hypothetical protein
MKHIQLLAACGLVTIKRFGRETWIFRNPAPIRLIQRNVVEKFARPWPTDQGENDRAQPFPDRRRRSRRSGSALP